MFLNKSLIFMLLAVFAWMLYPPLSNLILDRISPLSLAVFAHTFAAISMLLISFVILKFSKIKLMHFFSMDVFSKISVPVLFSGFLICANHLLLYMALDTSKEYDVIVILIFEAWPVIFLYLDSILRREKGATSFNEYLYSFLAFFGFILMMLPKIKSDASSLDADLLKSAGFAFFGGVAMAVNCFFRMKSMDRWQEVSDTKGWGLSGLELGVLTETSVRCIAAPVLLISFLLSNESLPVLTFVDFLLLLSIGVFILAIGSLLYDISIFYAKNASIGAFWYLMPVGAVFFLSILEKDLPTVNEMVATIMIVLSNAFIGFHVSLKKAILISLLIFTTFLLVLIPIR